MYINDFKVLTRLSEIGFLSFIFTTKFSIFPKSACLSLAIVLKFIVSQKENPKAFDFLFQKYLISYSGKSGSP